MIRVLPIILAICVAIVGVLVALVGVRALAFYEKAIATPISISCRQILQEVPEETYHFRLTDWTCGKSIYPNYAANEMDESGEPRKRSSDETWESVWVCLFPKGKRLHDNYASVLLEIRDVHSMPELRDYLDSGVLEFQCWPNRQEIDSKTYARMANKYRRMNFDSCVLGEVGGRPPSPNFGKSCIRIGIGCVVASVIGMATMIFWKMFRFLTTKSHDPWYEENEKEPVSNRANLPVV